MNGISKVEKKLSKKLSFSKDYPTSRSVIKGNGDKSTKHFIDKDINKQIDKKEGRRWKKKSKITAYLTDREEKLFREIYINRMSKGKKVDQSELIAEAIGLLHQKDFATQQKG